MVPHATLIEFVSVLAALRPVGDALALEFEDFRLERAGDRVSDLVLKFEEVCKVPVVPLGYYVMAGIRTDELRRDRTRWPDLRTLPSTT